jgi:hypothetical protein
MRILCLVIAAVSLLVCGAAHAQALAGSLSNKALGSTCDRMCLTDVMDGYLAALIAHRPARIDLATHVKFTENGVVLPAGSALWRTATALGTFKQYVVDPASHSIAFLGTIKEGNADAILSVRLALQDRVILEIEQIVLRNREGAAAWDSRAPSGVRAASTADWNAVVPTAERVPRERMIAIANSYFSALQGGAATPVPFAPDCYRIENGRFVSGAPNAGPDAPGNGPSVPNTGPAAGIGAGFSSATCSAQLAVKGRFAFNTDLRDRRYPVVDEERGIVFTHVTFDHSGKACLSGGGCMASLMINELFWIKNGVITKIAVNTLIVPYGMKSGWEK